MQTVKNKIADFNKIKQASVQRCPVYLCLSWLGRICERFAKQISQSAHRCFFFFFPPANVWVVFNTKLILTSIRKDVLSPHNNSLTCCCGLCYTGRTNQRLEARIKHVPTKIHNFDVGLTDNLKNTYWSSIAEQFINNCDYAEKFSVDLFSILNKAHSSFHLKVFETIYILSGRLSINSEDVCKDLILFRRSLQCNFYFPLTLHIFHISFFFLIYYPWISSVEQGSKPVS